jgi:carbon storage regulator
MLVLARKKNESIIINGNISVTVLSIINGNVRLGVSAPKDVPVHREEVQEAIESKDRRSDYGEMGVGG